MTTWYHWATLAAVVCLLALLVWRPVTELWVTVERLDAWAEESAKRPPDPPPPRRWDDDDQGYVY